MKRIEEIIDLIEITGDKCIILHKERGAYVVMKMDDYKGLVMVRPQESAVLLENQQNINGNVNVSGFSRPADLIKRYNTDIREFEVPEEDRFYPEPLES